MKARFVMKDKRLVNGALVPVDVYEVLDADGFSNLVWVPEHEPLKGQVVKDKKAVEEARAVKLDLDKAE